LISSAKAKACLDPIKIFWGFRIEGVKEVQQLEQVGLMSLLIQEIEQVLLGQDLV